MAQELHKSTTEPNQIRWTISGVQAAGFPKPSGLLPWSPAPKYYFTVVINGHKQWRSKDAVLNETVVSWEEPKEFTTSGSATLELRLYLHRAVGNDKQLVTQSQVVEGLIASHSPITWDLVPKMNANPAGQITFTITKKEVPIEPKKELDEAVGKAIEAHSAMHPPPEAPKLSAVGDAVKYVDDNASSVEKTWKPLLGKLDAFANLMDAVSEVHPYAKMACSVVLAAYHLYKGQKDRDEKMTTLVAQMTAAYDLVQTTEAVAEIRCKHEGVLKRLSIQTIHCGRFISGCCTERNFVIRAVKQPFSGVGKKIDDYGKKFEALLKELSGQSQVETEIMVLRVIGHMQGITEDLKDIAGKADLKDLYYAEGAGYNSSKRCLAGTRTQVINEITNWIINTADDTPRVFLLSGEAGKGKSAIAHSIASWCEDMKCLGSMFCFNISEAKARRPEHLFPTIAQDLADFDPVFKAALWHGIKDRRSVRKAIDLTTQFDEFIRKPSEKIAFCGSIVVVIDGLDEIGNPVTRQGMLKILGEKLDHLPPNFRILLTGRPELDIVKAFSKPKSQVTLKAMSTLQPEHTLLADVLKYIRAELIDERSSHWSSDGITDTDCRKLAEMSEGIFQWAFVACAHIHDGGRGGMTPRSRLESLTTIGQRTIGLYDLYTTVILARLNLENKEALENYRAVMGIVLTTFEPLSMATLEALVDQLTPGRSLNMTVVLPYLGSLLSGVAEHERDIPVRPLHTSFRDFLFSEDPDSGLTIGSSGHHERLAKACLRVLGRDLRFNICNLETSYRLNYEIPNLAVRVRECVPAHLSYAARFWARHLHNCTSDITPFRTDVAMLLCKNFLFWLEVLSLMNAVDVAESSLHTVSSRIIKAFDDKDLVSHTMDGLRFVRAFENLITSSAPHIYLSALANTPMNTKLATTFRTSFPRIPCIHLQHTAGWACPIQSVAFSPDGMRIVSGAGDFTIRIWDAKTGVTIGAPLEGHTDWVNSVAFSPDGTRIVSGSGDETVRIWDAETGVAIGAPLEGHTISVNSVAFSPDGTRIVSGSGDETVRIWDAETGVAIGAPLEGHTKWVNSVAFSPDGTCIVSGSGDMTIRIWDAKTGVAIGAPFKGHTKWVNSVAFSPDGTHIVSGSGDGTIQIWDAEMGIVIGAPLEGHTTSVNSVAFLPDGMRIVSGSADETV